jgi:crotonobetaine/carnitine-CoA ligase
MEAEDRMRAAHDWHGNQQDTVIGALRRAVSSRPNHPFLQMPDGKLTYAQFDRRSNALARGLKARGLKAGETITTILDNNLDCVLFWFAANKLGAIWVPVNTAYKGEFLRHLVADSSAAIVVAEQDYVDRMILIEDSLPEVREVYFRGSRPSGEFKRIKLRALSELYSEDDSPIGVPVSPEDLSLLIYTGGTTGPSKGCMISHNYACTLAKQGNMMNNRGADEVHWCCLPLFHFNATAAAVLATVVVAGTVYFTHRFSVSKFWESIEESRASVINLLGTMIPLLARAPEEPAMKRCFGQIRAVNGAPFTAELQSIWKERFGVEIAGVCGYGLTESTMLTSLPYGGYYKAGSAGKRNEWFDVRIFDDNNCELPPGEAGEIVARPLQPNVMFKGYWKRPAETLRVMSDMWFHTGDMGKFDEEGYLYFVDRKKDYLRRGGENISSFEMESTVARHPEIADVAVHAVKSPLSEDEVKVTAVLRPGAKLSARDLCLWMIERVPYFAVPRYVEFRDELPKSPLGRILKYQLRDEGCTPLTWDRDRSDVKFQKR